MDVSKSISDGECSIFETEEGYKIPCVKILIFCKTVKKLIFIQNIAPLIQCER